jgi:hypothetical protein
MCPVRGSEYYMGRPNGQVQLRPRLRDARGPRQRTAGPSAGTSVRQWPRTPPAPRENGPPRRDLAALPPPPTAQRAATPPATAKTSPADPLPAPATLGQPRRRGENSFGGPCLTRGWASTCRPNGAAISCPSRDTRDRPPNCRAFTRSSGHVAGSASTQSSRRPPSARLACCTRAADPP